MIYRYWCQNFFSINERVEIDFRSSSQNALSNTYIDNQYSRLSLIEAIIGANSSGKTNIVRALAFIQYLIVEPIASQSQPIPVESFIYNNQPTFVGVEFNLGGRFLEYEFKIAEGLIEEESIREKSHSAQKTTYKSLFYRKWDSNRKKYMLKGKEFVLPAGLYPSRHASIVATMKLTGQTDSLSYQIHDYWHNSIINILSVGDAASHLIKSPTELAKDSIGNLKTNAKLQNAVTEFLRQLDLGFYDFVDSKRQITKTEPQMIKQKYKQSNGFDLHIEYVSSGTKRLITLLEKIAIGLSQPSGLVALDELDAYLHPDISEFLIKLFTSPETNPNQIQLLVSTHNHQILSELDKQQITLVEKDDFGATQVYRLDDIKGVRSDDNYYAKYTAGAYGAKPNLV